MQSSSRTQQFSRRTGDEVGINRVKKISCVHSWAAVKQQIRQTSHSLSLLTCEMESSAGWQCICQKESCKMLPLHTRGVWHPGMGGRPLPWDRRQDRGLTAGESEAGAFYQGAVGCAWHFTAAMKELVLGSGRAVSVSLLADRSCGVCSPLCSLMSLPYPTYLMMREMIVTHHLGSETNQTVWRVRKRVVSQGAGNILWGNLLVQDWSKVWYWNQMLVEYKISQRKTGKCFNREHTEKRNILPGEKMQKKWTKTIKAFLSLKSLIVQMGVCLPCCCWLHFSNGHNTLCVAGEKKRNRTIWK